MLARARVAVAYRWRHGRWPDLDRPRRFTEHVQARKLWNRDPALARLTDKLAGKAVALGQLGAEAVIPTLWSGTELPVLPPAPLPLIVKANHGCNQTVVVRTLADWSRAGRIAPTWLTHAYGQWLDEWHYRAARRMLLVEPFVGDPAKLPLDYKVYVFHGAARLVQIHFDRGTPEHRWVQYDRQWKRQSRADGQSEAVAPLTLDAMLAAAERLAGDHDFLRVDFYEIEGRLLFGEFCLYPGSGLDPFDPPELDLRLGAYWGVPATRPAHVLGPIPVALGN